MSMKWFTRGFESRASWGRWHRTLAAIAPLLAMVGCTPANVAPTFEVGAGEFALAFDASVETLREFRFPIDRVDASAGVITTSTKASSGLATPWDREQSTATQELEDLLAYNSRQVRITFEPASSSGQVTAPPTGPGELETGRVVGRVEAVIVRRYTRGWRVSPAAILQSDFTFDTQASARGQPQEFDAPLTRDERLAARIAERIRERLVRHSPAPQ
jgi:hypothetical protein